MAQTTINRGEKIAIPFNITDVNNGLGGVRVTAAIGKALDNSAAILKKVGGLPGNSADITITSQTAAAIAGTINMLVADYATIFPAATFIATQSIFYISLWVDDGTGNDRCVTPGGADMLIINSDVPRA